MRRIILTAFLLTSGLARAAPDTARDHFRRGESLYEATRYEAALREFEVAQSLEPMPALLYDIARCLEQLGRNDEAAAAYERYLVESEAEATNADEVRSRVVELRRKPRPPEVVQLARIEPPPPKRRYVVPGALAGGTLALGIIGAGLLGSVAASYHSLDGTCSPNCSQSSWAGLPAREHAGEALLGIAGAAAAVDVYLWVREMRRK